MKSLKVILLILTIITINSCVQKKHLKTVTIKLDMNAIENPSNVGLRGNFTENAWQETLYLNDDDGNGIYEATFSQETAFNSVEFKFVNHDSIYELEGKDNRLLKFKYKPETIIYKATFNNPNSEQITIKK